MSPREPPPPPSGSPWRVSFVYAFTELSADGFSSHLHCQSTSSAWVFIRNVRLLATRLARTTQAMNEITSGLAGAPDSSSPVDRPAPLAWVEGSGSSAVSRLALVVDLRGEVIP